MAPVTNHHKLNGFLKKFTFIILQIWRSEIQNDFTELKIKVLAACVPSGGSKGESLSLFFQFLEAPFIRWLVAPSLTFKVSSAASSSASGLLFRLLLPCGRTLVTALGPPQ